MWLKTFVCDLDGVVVDLRPSIEVAVTAALGSLGGGEFGYDFAGLPLDEAARRRLFSRVFDDPATYDAAAPVPGASEALHRLVGWGWSVVGVTARPRHLRTCTRKWLDREGLPIERVIHTAVGNKAQVAVALGAHAAVEDRADEAELLADVCRSFLFSQPHNQNVAAGRAERVTGWHDLLSRIGQLTFWAHPRAGARAG